MRNTNYFVYATIILTVLLVYLFGELKYEKKIAKMRDLWLLEDTEALEEKLEMQEATIQTLAKQNKEYEIILSMIKLKMAEAREKGEEPSDEKPDPIQQSTIPKRPDNYPGEYIPKGTTPKIQGNLTI